MKQGAFALVTGCAGFVGSHLTQALLDRGVGVAGVDNFFSGFPHNMEGFERNPLFTFYEKSVTEEGLVGWIKDRSNRIVVDLPAPFGPMKPKISPSST